MLVHRSVIGASLMRYEITDTLQSFAGRPYAQIQVVARRAGACMAAVYTGGRSGDGGGVAQGKVRKA